MTQAKFDPYITGDVTREDFYPPIAVNTWLVSNHNEDGPGYTLHWVVIGSQQDAWATIHFYLQDQGCQVCDVTEDKHADASIDPFPHPFETPDTLDEIDMWWNVEAVGITRRKEN